MKKYNDKKGSGSFVRVRRESLTLERDLGRRRERERERKMSMGFKRGGFLLVLLLLLPAPIPVQPLSLSRWQTIFSLSHGLLVRVGNARAGRGDDAGAGRARKIADKLKWGFSLCGWIFSMARDYWLNYSSKTPEAELRSESSFDALSLLNEALHELRGIESNSEKAEWVAENYQRILGLSKNLIKQLQSQFVEDGPIREMVSVLKKEVEEGNFLHDCLELSANDLIDFLDVARGLFTFRDGPRRSSARPPNDQEL